MNNKEAFLSFLSKNKKIVTKAAVGIAILIAALFFYLYESSQAGELTVIDENAAISAQQQSSEKATSPEGISQETADIIIDIGGAVAQPGIVKLKEGGRVYEAVQKAGGFTAEADAAHINLAEKLMDGDKVWIPAAAENAITPQEQSGTVCSAIVSENASTASATRTASQNGKVNLNTADAQELQTLNGVGPSTAEKIINYRETRGGFKSIEDLKNVSGIGDKTFEKLKEYITV